MKKYIVAAVLLVLAWAPAGYAQTTVSGDITSNTTWSDDILLRGPVFVRSGATLTIAKGVTVFGEKASTGTLIVSQGGKLNINGTKDEPVVFTSDQSNPGRGEWGGIIINGYAPLNTPGGLAEGEGDTGVYGGTNPGDNSGTMRYFRIEFAGIEFSPDNELNGLALQGVGNGTTLEYLQVHANKDDCIEMFGGTVNWRYGIFTQGGDDSIDWTHGWTGSAQFAVTQKKGDDADHGIEADNYDEDNDALPRCNPTLYNVTLIGDPTFGDESTDAVLLRRGTAGTLRNFIVLGSKGYGVDIDDVATFEQAQNGSLIFDNSIFHGHLKGNFTDDADDLAKGPIPFTTREFMTTIMQNNYEGDPLLGNPYNLTNPDFRPTASSPAADGRVAVAAPPAGNSFIVATDFIGAVDPDNDWTRQPWTRFGMAPWTVDDDDPGDDDPGDDDPGDDDPTDDPDICAVTSALGQGHSDLALLRNFRDTVLAGNASGSLMTQLYYRYTSEVAAMIAGDALLRARVSDAITACMPLVRASLNGEQVELSEAAAAQMNEVIDMISPNAGLGLKIALFKAKMDIRRGELPF